MFKFRRNKSELIVLTGAIYSFVAYLTAFTLEVLFLIDLTRRNNDILSGGGGSSLEADFLNSRTTSTTTTTISLNARHINSNQDVDDQESLQNTLASSFDRFTFEAMQAHITISCLAISILYFVIFVTSLTLIVALILRSTFMLLIWMCAMTTLYLPEFGLVTYVSVYSWGLGTRNGQTELAFYLLRAVLNLIFIFRAHKLFKQWNYEKNFFRLKSSTSGGAGLSSLAASHHFAGGAYDSPYFISGGDSLSTTINPMFSGSTLNLNRYDYVRAGGGGHYKAASSSSRNTSPTTNQSVFSNDLITANTDGSGSRHSSMAGGRGRLAVASMYSRELANSKLQEKPPSKFYLGESKLTTPPPSSRSRQDRASRSTPDSNQNNKSTNNTQIQRNDSMLSINDDLDADYEMDLDYRTLNSKRHQQHENSRLHHQIRQPTPTMQNLNMHPHREQAGRYQQQYQPRHKASGHYNPQQQQMMMSRSQDNLTYSTQSLDRRNLRDFGFGNEQVILKPLGHQPFEYLHRPGSTSNLNSVGINPTVGANNTHHQRHHHHHY